MTAASTSATGVGLSRSEVAATPFRSLRDPARLRLVLCLQAGARSVVDLGAQIGSAQGTVRAHLACLRDRGLLDVRPVRRQSVLLTGAVPDHADAAVTPVDRTHRCRAGARAGSSEGPL